MAERRVWVVGAGVARLALASAAWGQCEQGWSEAFVPGTFSGRGTSPTVLHTTEGSRLVVHGLRRAGDDGHGLQVWDGSSWSTWPALTDDPNARVLVQALNLADPPRLAATVDARFGEFDVLVLEAGSWRSLGFPSFRGIEVANSLIGGWAQGSADIYVGGRFEELDVGSTGVFHWDGSAWSSLDFDPEGRTWVGDLVWFDDGSGTALYASTDGWIGGVKVGGVARWDGARWSQVGAGCPVGHPGLAVHDDGSGNALWAISGDTLARWDGIGWESFDVGSSGGGLTSVLVGTYRELVWRSSDVVRRWNGSSGEIVGRVAGGVLGGLVADETGDLGGGLFVVGSFIRVDDAPASCVARWDGGSWHAAGTEEVGNGVPSPHAAYAVGEQGGPQLGGRIYVGDERSVGGDPAEGVATWDGASWRVIGPAGLDGAIHDFQAGDLGSGFRLFAAGADDSVFAWDGGAWAIAADDVDDGVNELTFGRMPGGDPMLFVGGSFREIGGETFNYVAGLSADGWVHLGDGIPSPQVEPGISGLEVHDDGSGPALYLGCFFAEWLDEPLKNSVARWGGERWEPVGEPGTAFAGPPSERLVTGAAGVSCRQVTRPTPSI